MQFYKKWGGKWVWVWTWSFGDAGQTDASQPYGSNGLATEASTCMETSQQGWNCSTAQRTQSTDENDSMANSEEFLRNSYEQIIQKLQSSRDLIWPKV